MQFSCPFCGGSRLEHLRNCPKAYSIVRQRQFNEKSKKDYFGASPNLFVGRFGYPNVNVGFLSSENLPEDTDDPKAWANKNHDIPKLLDIRTSLINSSFKAQVKSFDQKFLEMSQEIAMAKSPVDVEVHLDRKPIFNISADRDVTAFGPSAKLEKAAITENPKITTHVENVVSDTDLKAVEAMTGLYKKGYDEHFLTKLISAGTLGIGENRKLVPTRWSITAVDDTLGKNLIKEVRDFKHYDYVAHFGGYLGNYYLMLFFPDIWSYELFETYAGNPAIPKEEIETMTDYEDYGGRKAYASNTVGGYYAARLGVLEYLKEKKKQAKVLALRFITDEYYMGMGVWVVREAARNALRSQPIVFSDKNLMLSYARQLVKQRFSIEADALLNRSKILASMRQRKLGEF